MAVYKNTTNNEKWSISDMMAHIPEEMISDIEPQGDDLHCPSPERIKELAIKKRNDYLDRNEELTMKKTAFSKKTIRITLIAAIVALLNITVFAAAYGGLDFIKGIFGDSAEIIENEIVTPLVSASADGRDMAVEALVTDGFITNMVVSLTGEKPSDTNIELFTVTTNTGIRSNGWYELEDFSTQSKTYYAVDLISEERFNTADITLSLNKNVAPIDLSIQVKNNLGNVVINLPDGAMSGETELKELQISSMGFLLIGTEEKAQGGLPATNIRLVFSDGTTEDLEVEFDPSDELVGGGGGAILSANSKKLPLVTTFHGIRNPDSEIVISGKFSRIINPAGIEKIIVGGVEYPAK